VKKTVIHLKARLNNKNKIKIKLVDDCEAKYIGEYQQLDTYFKVPEGHLKIRQLKGTNNSHLLYYSKESLKGVKERKIWFTGINDPEALKTLLNKIFPIMAEVNNHREIYTYKNIQIHLDEVEFLGTFINFELEVKPQYLAKKNGQKFLIDFMKYLNLNEENLEEYSYSDLISNLI
jgi:predicted adenylyl cyclase CyaB